jgi:DNA mismatch repair ATPase MutL
MEKPNDLQLVDLEAINERVKQEYIGELQKELTEYRELLTKQLLEKAERVEQQKLAAKREKLLAEVEKEVNGVFSEQLVVPD